MRKERGAATEFFAAAGKKFVENILSIKVWIIFVYMFLSGIMVAKGLMSGEVFATSNGSVISIVIALRESFKTQKIKALANGSDEESKKKVKEISI